MSDLAPGGVPMCRVLVPTVVLNKVCPKLLLSSYYLQNDYLLSHTAAYGKLAITACILTS
jgi:hypothetical protein